MDRINILQKEIEKDYGSDIIEHVWVKQEPQTDPVMTKSHIIQALKGAENNTICFYIPYISKIQSELIAAIEQAAKTNRIYILTREYEENYDQLLKGLSEHCLIRTEQSLAGNFILLKNGDIISGYFSTDFQGNALHMELNTEQCKEFWHYFIHCFWYRAKKEYIDGELEEVTENHQDPFMPPMQNGFDESYISPLAGQEYDNVYCGISQDSFLKNNIHNFNSCHFLLKDKNLLGNEELTRTDSNTFMVCPIDFDFIDDKIFLSDNDTLLYVLQLNRMQKENFHGLIRAIEEQKKLEFYHSISLREICQKTIITLEGQEELIKAHDTHEDSISCDSFIEKYEFENLELAYDEIHRELYPFVCELGFKYAVNPYFTPKEFKRAKLYRDWEDAHRALHEYIDKELKNIENAQKKQEELSGLKSLLEGVMKFFRQSFLGTNTKLNSIKEDLERINAEASVDFINRDIMIAYQEKLEAYAKNIDENNTELSSKLTEAKAHNQWQSEKEKLEQEIQNLEAQCNPKEQDLAAKKEEQQTQGQRLKELEHECDKLEKEYETLKNTAQEQRDKKLQENRESKKEKAQRKK